MEYSIINNAGYYKDYIASILFLIAIIILYKVKDLNKLKNMVLCILILCFFVDLSFTINPEYHYTKIGYNTPSYIIFGGALILIFITLINYKKLT